MTAMTSSRPYIFRAIYDWIVDNGLTPYILVNASAPGADVPPEYVDGGRIVLNVSPRAVHQWHQDSESLSFSARFNGQSRGVTVPLRAVLAIYARENGKGMVFDKDEPEPPPSSGRPTEPAKSRPKLQIVK
jgi:stringent starvation protein B